MRSERERLRPSVLAIAGFLLLGCGVAAWAAMDFDPRPDARVSDAELARHGRRGASRGDRASRSGRGASHARGLSAGGGSGAYAHHDWGQETELQRSMALGLPGPTFWRDVEERGLPERDPQIAAMYRSFHMLGGDGPPPLPFEPTARRAVLVDSAGDVDAAPTSCDVRVLPVTSGRFNCVVRVMCDGRVLYPNPAQTAGYVPCELGEDGQPVRALDQSQTARDGDPLVDLDLSNGTVTVEEQDETGQPRYRATLRITG